MSASFCSHWCRLCASDTIESKDLHSLGQDIVFALEKYFEVKICADDPLGTKLCSCCNKLLHELVAFSTRVNNAKAMFEAARLFDKDATIDVRAFRKQWGLEESISSMESDGISADTHIMLNQHNAKAIQPEFIDVAENTEMQGNSFHDSSFNQKCSQKDFKMNGLVEDPRNREISDEQEQICRYNVNTDHGEFLVTVKDEPGSPQSEFASEETSSLNESEEFEPYERNIKTEKHNSLMCHLCGKSYLKGKYYNVHLTQCTGNTRIYRPATCEICNKTMSCPKNLKIHKLQVHQDMKPYVCETCGKAFKVKKALKDHQISHTEERPHLCPICNKGFKNSVQLNKHSQSHGEPQFECDTCGKKLQTRAKLRVHKLIHNEPKYECEYCGKRSVNSDTFKNHLLSHVGIKPYVCKYCKKPFTSKSICCKHTLKEHPQEYELDDDKEFLRNEKVPHLNELRTMVRAMAEGLN